jgi:hypothetical protein
VTEREFQREIIRYARSRGWLVAHFGNTVKYVRRGSIYKVIPDPDAAGFLDLTMVRGGRLVFAEIKGKTGRVTEKQQGWVDALSHRDLNVEVYVWKWADGLLEHVQSVLE